MTDIFLIVLVCCSLPTAYFYFLAFASARKKNQPAISAHLPFHRFLIAIPAHNEENVIATTVKKLNLLDYPSDLYQIHIVADYCSDKTARLARRAGAFVHERNEGPRSGKGGALSWLFNRVLNDEFSAIVIFDSDTKVDPNFLRVMNARLAQGYPVRSL